MSPLLKRIPSDQELPAMADVVVIGGGIIGASAAFSLAERSWTKDRLSPFERTRVLDPTPSRRTIAAILKGVTAQFPALAGIEVADSWGAYVDCTPDAVPVISASDHVKGLYLAAGGSGHGFGIGPGIGRLAADLVANDEPCVDPTPFRLSGFFDGSRVEVGGL